MNRKKIKWIATFFLLSIIVMYPLLINRNIELDLDKSYIRYTDYNYGMSNDKTEYLIKRDECTFSYEDFDTGVIEKKAVVIEVDEYIEILNMVINDLQFYNLKGKGKRDIDGFTSVIEVLNNDKVKVIESHNERSSREAEIIEVIRNVFK